MQDCFDRLIPQWLHDTAKTPPPFAFIHRTVLFCRFAQRSLIFFVKIGEILNSRPNRDTFAIFRGILAKQTIYPNITKTDYDPDVLTELRTNDGRCTVGEAYEHSKSFHMVVMQNPDVKLIPEGADANSVKRVAKSALSEFGDDLSRLYIKSNKVDWGGRRRRTERSRA